MYNSQKLLTGFLVKKYYFYIMQLYIYITMTKIYLSTVATEEKLYMKYLIESIKKNNGELKILGYGEKWKGFNWRNLLMKEYLKTLDKNDVVCFIDGYDVLCLRNLSHLVDKFIEIQKREQCKIIVAYDRVLNPIDNFFVSLYFGKCNNISLNAGTYIGYVGDILEMINLVFIENNDVNADDQVLLTKVCNLNKGIIYIDVKNEIFLTISDRLTDISNNLIVNENKEVIYNNNKPFFLHCPGSYFDELLIKLDYDYDENINKEIYKRYYQKFPYMRYIDIFLFLKKEEIFLIVIILLLIIVLWNKKL